MKVYETSQIRNVVLLGHGGSGKTTTAEAMAFVSGAITKMGTVTAGNKFTFELGVVHPSGPEGNVVFSVNNPLVSVK